MLNRLQPASRLLIRASLGVFTAIVLLLIQSAFWSTRVSAWMQAIIFATALLSYFRPRYGLLAIALLAPLGQVGSRTLDSQMRGAEALVLAFLAGALVRGWTLREFRAFPSTRLDVAALIFGFVVAASCLEQIWYSQIQMDFAWPFTQDLLSYAARNYITASRSFGMLPRAMWLLEGVALLLFVVRYVRASDKSTQNLAIALVLGAVVPAILTVTAFATDFAQTRNSGGSLVGFLARGRWIGHLSDINAGGSYFAMTALMALGMGVTKREWRWGWLVIGALLLGTTAITGSRTAVAAAGCVAVFLSMRLAVSHPSHFVRGVSAACAIVAIGAALLLVLRTTGGPPSESLYVRWGFLRTTAAMLSAEPAFGVGVGQFSIWSGHFAPPELLQRWRPDNAHNNLAQIAGELGLIGLIAFLIVLIAPFWERSENPEAASLRGPFIAGVSAFMLTWLGGHPLLVPEASFPFWITLGVVAALGASGSRANLTAGVAGIAAVLLILSIPFRVDAKSADLDFSAVSYGLSSKRLMTSRARFFVPAGKSRVELPLRVRGASEEEPVAIEVLVDGSALETITVTDRNWRQAPVDLVNNSSRRFHQIDLRIRPDTIDSLDPLRSTVEVGKWEIISKPNG